jgi:NADH-quinone oxidoreductase subunit N
MRLLFKKLKSGSESIGVTGTGVGVGSIFCAILCFMLFCGAGKGSISLPEGGVPEIYPTGLTPAAYLGDINYMLADFFTFCSFFVLIITSTFLYSQFQLKLRSFKILSKLFFQVLYFCIFLNLENLFISVSVFNGTLVYSPYTSFFKILVCLALFVCVINSESFLTSFRLAVDEFFIIIMALLLGLFFFISSFDLICLFFNLELQSFCFYILITFKRNSVYSSEAALTYFVAGTVSSGLFLLGIFLVYFYTGLTNFEDLSKFFTGFFFYCSYLDCSIVAITGITFLCSGFLFKMAIVPFHMWVPDVYEGSPSCITMVISTLPKIAFLSVFIRFFFVTFYDFIAYWQPVLFLLSFLSVFVSCFFGIRQHKLKRLMAYSSIGHMGFIFLGVSTCSMEGLQGSVFHLIVYLVTSLGLWTALTSKFVGKRIQVRYISDLTFLVCRNKLLGFVVSFLFLSMAGVPPFAGFFSKTVILMASVKSSYFYMSCLILLLTLVSSFYYVRFLKITYFSSKVCLRNSDFEFRRESLSREKSLILSFSFFFVLFSFYFFDFINLITFKLMLYVL